MNMDDWPIHFTLYWVGVHAYENDWLAGNDIGHHNLADNVNMTAVCAGVAIQMILAAISSTTLLPDPVSSLLLSSVQAVASIEMSLVVVYAFQVYANKPWPSIFMCFLVIFGVIWIFDRTQHQ